MPETLAGLTSAELASVERVVDALVGRDTAVLAASGAYDDGAQPFMYVDDYYGTRGVDLVRPPGAADSGPGHVLKSADRPGWAAVDVAMFDRSERPD